MRSSVSFVETALAESFVVLQLDFSVIQPLFLGRNLKRTKLSGSVQFGLLATWFTEEAKDRSRDCGNWGALGTGVLPADFSQNQHLVTTSSFPSESSQ